MDVLEQLAWALGLASLAGIKLYLTTFITGLAIRYDWLNLATEHENLSLLGNEWIIIVAGTFTVIEFFADKIPWLDSGWDALHTILRPAGGILLGLAALGDMDPVILVIGGLLSGSISLTTHAAKAGARLLVNLSPEPVSNSIASVAEDGIVLGGLTLAAFAPIVFVIFCVVLISVSIFMIRKSFGKAHSAWGNIAGKFSHKYP